MLQNLTLPCSLVSLGWPNISRLPFVSTVPSQYLTWKHILALSTTIYGALWIKLCFSCLYHMLLTSKSFTDWSIALNFQLFPFFFFFIIFLIWSRFFSFFPVFFEWEFCVLLCVALSDLRRIWNGRCGLPVKVCFWDPSKYGQWGIWEDCNFYILVANMKEWG